MLLPPVRFNVSGTSRVRSTPGNAIIHEQCKLGSKFQLLCKNLRGLHADTAGFKSPKTFVYCNPRDDTQ